MTAQTLRATFDTVYLLALTAWIGSVLFFTAVVAPLGSKGLGPEAGGRFVRALLPRYYAWGTICGALALPALVCAALCFEELRGPAVGLQAAFVLAGTLIMLYSGNVLTPALNAARDLETEQHEKYERLHHRSVTLNSFVLIVGLGLLIAFANRPTIRVDWPEARRAASMRKYQQRYQENNRLNREFWRRHAAEIANWRPRPVPAAGRRRPGTRVAKAGSRH